MRIEAYGSKPEKSPTDGRLNEKDSAQMEWSSGENSEKPGGGSLDTPSRVGNELGTDYLKEKNAEVSNSKFENDLNEIKTTTLEDKD